MKKLYILQIILLLSVSVRAQQWTWAKHLSGVYGAAMDEDTLGNIYAAEGLTSWPNPTSQFEKLNSNGLSAWTQTLNCIIQSLSVGKSNVVISGSFTGTVAFGSTILTSVGFQDGFLASYDYNGNLKWVKQCTGLNDNTVSSVAISSSDEIFVSAKNDSTGSFAGFNFQGGYAICIFDTTGALLNSFEIASHSVSYVNKITLDKNDNIYITGTFTDQNLLVGGIQLPCPDTYYGAYFIAKLNKFGTAYWAKAPCSTYKRSVNGLTANEFGDVFYSISVTYSNESLYKLSAGGNLIWAKSFGSSTYGAISCITPDKSGNLYLTGSSWYYAFIGSCQVNGFQDFLFLAKIDSSGSCIWTQKGVAPSASGGISLSIKNSSVTVLGFASDAKIIQLSPLSVQGTYFVSRISENLVTGIPNNIVLIDVSIFPNPTSGIFNVTNAENLQNIKVYNSLGKIIYEKSGNHSSMEMIDLTGQSKGIYLIELSNSFQTYTRKISVQ